MATLRPADFSESDSLLRGEASFRGKLTSEIVTLAKGADVPASVRASAIGVLSIVIICSFEFCILVLHVLCAARHWVATAVNFNLYLSLFVVQALIGASFFHPLITGLSSISTTANLASGVVAVAKKQKTKSRARRANEPAPAPGD